MQGRSATGGREEPSVAEKRRTRMTHSNIVYCNCLTRVNRLSPAPAIPQ